MESNPYDFLPVIVGSGIVGLLLFLLFVIVSFVVSAFIMSLWVRLILVFMRKALDREYARVRLYDYSRGAEYLERAESGR